MTSDKIYDLYTDIATLKSMPRKNRTPSSQNQTPNPLPCIQKRRFTSEQEALDAAEYQMFMKMSLQLGVYKCDYCHGWHLTNIGKK